MDIGNAIVISVSIIIAYKLIKLALIASDTI